MFYYQIPIKYMYSVELKEDIMKLLIQRGHIVQNAHIYLLVIMILIIWCNYLSQIDNYFIISDRHDTYAYDPSHRIFTLLL